MFSSPHLVRFNERIRVAGALIDDEQLATHLTEVLDASTGIQPSFFEVATAVALLAFSRTPADACILEVGLGGRLDATNVVEHPLVCGIASLGLDHQSWLGRSLVEIAGEKAAIAKRGVPLVTQLYPPRVASRIAEIAADARAPWMPRGGPWDAIVRQGKLRYSDAQGNLDLPLPRLPGRHQALNAALAVAMLRHQDRIAVPESALAAAMGWANGPARMEKLSDGRLTGLAPPGTDVWVDGGHNPSAARAIATYAKRNFAGDKPFVLMFASLTTKDARGVLAPFAGIADRVLTVPIHGHESRDPTDLAQLAISLGMPAEPHATLQSALRALTGPSRVLIFGSLYLAGVALAAHDQLPD
jgi:dihydrofolate synthase/folylpolyglutamate synthase